MQHPGDDRFWRWAKQASLACGIMMSVISAQAIGQEKTYADEYQNRIKSAGAIQGLGDTPFGEAIDLYTGATSFQQTDLVLEGKGPAIRIGRRSVSGDFSAANQLAFSGFGDWQLEIPQIRTLVAGTTRYGSTVGDWRVYLSTGEPTLDRCTHMDGAMWSPPPGYVGLHSGGVDPSFWWQGYQLDVSGGSQGILIRAGGAPAPATGFYPGVTTQHWQVGCLPATSNGQPGQAFFALAPDGTKYSFTHLVYEQYTEFRDTDPYAPTYRAIQPRNIAAMKVTRIEDRFGNYLTYGYSGDKLTSISASDGRAVTIEWWADAPLIRAITSNGRVWHYDYASRSSTGGTLSQVTLPDSSSWVFTGSAASPAFAPVTMLGCFTGVGTDGLPAQGSASGITQTYSVKSPSGATGVFSYSTRLRAQSYMPTFCIHYDPQAEQGQETANPYFLLAALVRREVSGPGIATATWNYTYEPAKASTDRDCGSNGCQSTTYTDVQGPDNTMTRHIHSTRHAALQGKLLRVEVYQNGGALQRAEDRSYNFAEADRPYSNVYGSSLFTASPSYGAENLVVLRKTVLAQQARNFIWEVPAGCPGGLTGYCFDAFGRATKTLRASSQ